MIYQSMDNEAAAATQDCAMKTVSDDADPQTHPQMASEETHVELAHDAAIDTLMQELSKIPSADDKLQHAIQFMQQALAQNGAPRFRSFWKARDLCLDLFKDSLSHPVRTASWAHYTELTKEARRLKALLEEQSAFASEQIDMAITALENEIEKQLDNCPPYQLSIKPQTLEANLTYYCNVQGELAHLNSYASRINALRKELIKTEMRVRKKNQFFQRLSQAGDRVFPKRKELIKEISQAFTQDIDSFVSTHFSGQRLRESLYVLREEIKALQGIAKELTLNANAFTHTRTQLSDCWDKLKVLDKERKQYRAEKKVVFKQNMDVVLQKIEEFNQGFQSGSISMQEAQRKIEEIVDFMRNQELGRDEVSHLREQLDVARRPFLDKLRSEENARQEQERERTRQKKEKLDLLRQDVATLLQEADGYSLEQLIERRDAILEAIHNASILKAEKQELERKLKSLKEIIVEKQEQALLNLSDDDKKSLEQLKELLEQRKGRRQACKEQLEILRKAKGSSGLDFEKALEYNKHLNDEKDRYEKLNLSIAEVEDKIAALEGPL